MKERVLTGLGVVAILILALLGRELSLFIFDGFWLVVTILCAYEMSNLLTKMGAYNNKWLVMSYPIMSYLLYFLCINRNIKTSLTIVLQIALIVLIGAIYVLCKLINRKATDNEIKTRKLYLSVEKFSVFKGIQTIFGFLYPTVLLMFFIFLSRFDLFGQALLSYEKEISRFILIMAFFIPVATDSLAMLTGLVFKGKKAFPKISPKKTISGVIGGIFWGTCSAMVLYLVFSVIGNYSTIFEALNIKIWHMAILGFVGSIFSQAGDILESVLKRKADVKDSGKLLPGHGGMLDRVDSHMVCSVVVFIFFIILL